jgi:hypothetical protein
VASPSEANEPLSYRGYRYPIEVISHAVWLYFRFHLSLRDVEELLAERGVTVTYGTIRAWCIKFGPTYAAGLRRRRARPSDKWHLDEVQLKIKGKRHWLWRAVDKHGVVLDILVQQLVINAPPKPSYGASWRRLAASRAWSSPTNCRVTRQPCGACCRTLTIDDTKD